MVISAWVVFTAFSLGCGLANSLEQLIAFRALQGVGGSGLYSLCNVRTYTLSPNFRGLTALIDPQSSLKSRRASTLRYVGRTALGEAELTPLQTMSAATGVVFAISSVLGPVLGSCPTKLMHVFRIDARLAQAV